MKWGFLEVWFSQLKLVEFLRKNGWFSISRICYILLRFCPHPSLFLQTITSAKVLWLLSLASIKLISVPFLVGCSSSGFCDAMIVKFGVLGLGRNTFLALLGVKLMSWGRRCGLGLVFHWSSTDTWRSWRYMPNPSWLRSIRTQYISIWMGKNTRAITTWVNYRWWGSHWPCFDARSAARALQP